METSTLQEIFQNEDSFELIVVTGLEQFKYHWEMSAGQVEVVFLGCGSSADEESIAQTINFFDEIKALAPDIVVIPVSLNGMFLKEIASRLSGKFEEQIDLSIEDKLKESELIQKIKNLSAMRESRASKGKIPGLLLVDDEENILKILTLCFKSAGFNRVWKAQTYEGALVTFHDNLDEIDVCLVDYNLGDRKADGLIRRIKEMGPNVKVFMLTGEGKGNYPWGEETAQLLAGVIHKPIYDIEEAIVTINNVLQKEAALLEGLKKKVLVIDDSPETGQFIEKILEGDYLVIKAPDGETGLKKFEELKPALVILDYRLPGKNGLEVLREIKKIQPEARVIAVTIEKNTEVIKEFYRLGVAGLVQKPIAAGKIEELILKELK
jgi:DNA-binding response OmpR family regulator